MTKSNLQGQQVSTSRPRNRSESEMSPPSEELRKAEDGRCRSCSSDKSRQAPIGLDVETIAEQMIEVKQANRGVETAEDNNVLAQVEPVEAAIRQHSACQTEFEVASFLNKVAAVLDNYWVDDLAAAIRTRARTLVANGLNRLDRFDR